MYAIVDIETTGGYAAANGITEIAVRITDGSKIISSYDSLVNPVYSIPNYVQSLTGITNEMVCNEKVISEIAQTLYELLHDKIFVAHNVNFDYSFIKYHLSQSGYDLNCKKLCTIRYGRKIIPGLKSYGLGNFCRAIGINIENRHRAGGDADATAVLFHHLLKNDRENHIEILLKGKSKEQSIPPNLPIDQINKLPGKPGVYYFHNIKGKIIYVGKAKNLNKRVSSHFTNNKPNKQKQAFLNQIHNITFQECATELMAFILECAEIKKLWPEQNRSMKRFEHAYALYAFNDNYGYTRLAIDKKKTNLNPLYTFNLLTEGHNLLRKLGIQFKLCPKLCYLQHYDVECAGKKDNRCSGACDKIEPVKEYNFRVKNCIEYLNTHLPSFALKDKGIGPDQVSYILIEKGRFYGMGCLPERNNFSSIALLKDHLTQYAENDYIRTLVYNYANKFPEKKMIFDELLK